MTSSSSESEELNSSKKGNPVGQKNISGDSDLSENENENSNTQKVPAAKHKTEHANMPSIISMIQKNLLQTANSSKKDFLEKVLNQSNSKIKELVIKKTGDNGEKTPKSILKHSKLPQLKVQKDDSSESDSYTDRTPRKSVGEVKKSGGRHLKKEDNKKSMESDVDSDENNDSVSCNKTPKGKNKILHKLKASLSKRKQMDSESSSESEVDTKLVQSLKTKSKKGSTEKSIGQSGDTRITSEPKGEISRRESSDSSNESNKNKGGTMVDSRKVATNKQKYSESESSSDSDVDGKVNKSFITKNKILHDTSVKKSVNKSKSLDLPTEDKKRKLTSTSKTQLKINKKNSSMSESSDESNEKGNLKTDSSMKGSANKRKHSVSETSSESEVDSKINKPVLTKSKIVHDSKTKESLSKRKPPNKSDNKNKSVLKEKKRKKGNSSASESSDESNVKRDGNSTKKPTNKQKPTESESSSESEIDSIIKKPVLTNSKSLHDSSTNISISKGKSSENILRENRKKSQEKSKRNISRKGTSSTSESSDESDGNRKRTAGTTKVSGNMRQQSVSESSSDYEDNTKTKDIRNNTNITQGNRRKSMANMAQRSVSECSSDSEDNRKTKDIRNSRKTPEDTRRKSTENMRQQSISESSLSDSEDNKKTKDTSRKIKASKNNGNFKRSQDKTSSQLGNNKRVTISSRESEGDQKIPVNQMKMKNTMKEQTTSEKHNSSANKLDNVKSTAKRKETNSKRKFSISQSSDESNSVILDESDSNMNVATEKEKKGKSDSSHHSISDSDLETPVQDLTLSNNILNSELLIDSKKLLNTFVSEKDLSVVSLKSETFVSDITKDVEVFFVQIPKNIHPQLLTDNLVSLNGQTKFKIEDDMYVWDSSFENLHSLNIIGPTKQQSCSIRSLKPKRAIVVRKQFHLKHKPTKLHAVNEVIDFPTSIKDRHPLFGTNYEEKIQLEENVLAKLNNSVRIHKKSKKKHKNKEMSLNNDNSMDIFKLLNDHSTDKDIDKHKEKKKKKKHSNKSYELDQEDITEKKKNVDTLSSLEGNSNIKRKKEKRVETDTLSETEYETPVKKIKKSHKSFVNSTMISPGNFSPKFESDKSVIEKLKHKKDSKKHSKILKDEEELTNFIDELVNMKEKKKKKRHTHINQ